MIKLNHALVFKYIVDSVCSIVICKSLKPYIYEMSCFLYSGRYKIKPSKMNPLLCNLFLLNKSLNNDPKFIIILKNILEKLYKLQITKKVLKFNRKYFEIK